MAVHLFKVGLKESSETARSLTFVGYLDGAGRGYAVAIFGEGVNGQFLGWEGAFGYLNEQPGERYARYGWS